MRRVEGLDGYTRPLAPPAYVVGIVTHSPSSRLYEQITSNQEGLTDSELNLHQCLDTGLLHRQRGLRTRWVQERILVLVVRN